MSEKTILISGALILALGISQTYVWGQDSSSPTGNATMTLPVAIQMGKTADRTACGNEQNTYNTCIKKLRGDCRELGEKNGDHTLGDPDPANPNSFPNCLKASTDCTTLVDNETNKAGRDLYTQLNPTPDPSDPDSSPTPDPNPPAPGDPRYCDPSAGTDPDTTSEKVTPATSPTSTPSNEGCMALSAQNKIDLLDNSLNGDDSTLTKKQKAFDTAQKNLSDQSNSCYGQMKSAQDAIAKAQLDLASAQKEEMTALGGLNTTGDEKMDQMRAAIDKANIDMAQITGPDATNAVSAYSLAINQALADCRQNLVMLGKANQLKYGSLSEALGATSVGLTASKCQTDFTYQQKKAAAWMAFVQAQQQNQVKFMAVQAQITSLNRQINTTNFGQEVAKSGLETNFANRMASDQMTITQANGDLTQAQATCGNNIGASQHTANIAMQGTTRAEADARLEYCEEEYLKKKYNIADPDGKTSSDLRDLKKDHKDLVEDACVDPCAKLPPDPGATPVYREARCTDYCNNAPVVAAPAAAPVKQRKH